MKCPTTRVHLKKGAEAGRPDFANKLHLRCVTADHPAEGVGIASIDCEIMTKMATAAVPIVTAMEAQAEASLFLSDNLPDRISASNPILDENGQVWRVPAILAYPHLGVLGCVGEIEVSTVRPEVLSSTPVEEMLARALSLAEQHRDAIEAPLP
jgi:hypothetical protein